MILLPWQLQQWQQLYDYKKQNRIPQALIISGSKGIGKLSLAEQFTYSLLCESPTSKGLNCGNCKSCLLIKANAHPDFIKIYPEESGKIISIWQIRHLLNQLNLKPQYDTYRVVIIHPAEQLNNSAANAFLKFLEEPNERTIVILVSNHYSNIPATILSRCQKLVLTKPDKAASLEWLKCQNPQLSKTEAEIILNINQGSPFQSLDFDKRQLMSIRKECFKNWLEVAGYSQKPTLVAEKWLKYEIAEILDWVTSWIIDIIKCKHSINAQLLFNPDFEKQLRDTAKKIQLIDTFKLYDLLLISKQRIDTQLNKQSILEEILIGWHRLNQVIH